MKLVKHYAAVKSFIPLHPVKAFFEPHISTNFFPGESNHSLEPTDKKTTKLPRIGFFERSSKFPGRVKDVTHCFWVYYKFDTTKQTFMLTKEYSNLSHNHELPLQSMTVVDGITIVNLEYHLTPEEFVSIKEQSRCRVGVPQISVNLEDSFPDCTFSAPMLYQIQDKFLKEKYGNDTHNLHGLFMKGDKI